MSKKKRRYSSAEKRAYWFGYGAAMGSMKDDFYRHKGDAAVKALPLGRARNAGIKGMENAYRDMSLSSSIPMYNLESPKTGAKLRRQWNGKKK